MNGPSLSTGGTPHSSTYTRVYNEAFSKYYNEHCRGAGGATPEMINACRVMADCDAYRAEVRERATDSSQPSWRQPSNPYAFDIPSTSSRAALYTSMHPTPYPVPMAPTETDLYNQAYWRRRDDSRNQQNQQEEERRRQWNQWMNGNR